MNNTYTISCCLLLSTIVPHNYTV